MTVLLDPTHERIPTRRERLPRPASLHGLTAALLDISKARGSVFIDRLEALLNAEGIATKRYNKPTFARVAPLSLRQQIAAECQVVIQALAD